MQTSDHQAKYHKLTNFLKEEMFMGNINPGEQIPSENTLSEMFAISRHTVRKAISILVNEGYLSTEHGRGTYCLDRNQKRNDTKNIGVITTYLSEYIFPKVIQGIDSVLSSKGYSILLKNTNNQADKEAQCLKEVLDKHIDGLIIEPTKSALFTDNLKFYEALDRHHIPYLFIHGHYPQLSGSSHILLDDAQGMETAVSYLAKLGHKRIIGVFKADDIQGLDRHKGYARALMQAGLPYNPDDVVWFHTEDRETKPYHLIRQMVDAKKAMDAIVCYNDEIAFKIFELLTGLGLRVPEDISLTGFDDSHYSAGCPVKITSLGHPKEKLGEMAAELLLQMLKDKDYLNHPVQRIIPPELIIKESCIQRF